METSTYIIERDPQCGTPRKMSTCCDAQVVLLLDDNDEQYPGCLDCLKACFDEASMTVTLTISEARALIYAIDVAGKGDVAGNAFTDDEWQNARSAQRFLLRGVHKVVAK